MRDALASSLNIPAVGLLERVGVRDYGGFLLRLGFESLAGDAAADAGLGLALGNAPVSLLELARSFSVFPNDGSLLELRFTLNDDADRADGPPASERVISPDTARIICSFLSDRDARYLGFGRARNFAADFPVIVKTGTANQYQSIVALAASRRYTCAVWMGNFAGETVMGKTGSSVPAAAARDALVFLHGRDAAPPATLAFGEPERFAKAPVCAVSGLGPSADCPAAVWEYVEAGRAPPVCGWHGSENGVPSVRYPAEYQSWLLAARRSGGLQEEGELEIVTPRDGFVFFAAPQGVRRQAIPAEVTGGSGAELRVAYDGAEWTEARPFRFFLPLERGTHTLSVRCGDETREVRFMVE
jgi:penicillin-binding protein 1C